MSEQTPAAEEQQQTVDTPVEGTDTQDTAAQVNWEERYKEAQSWGTRLAQERAELEAEAQLARALKSEDPAEYSKALLDAGFGEDALRALGLVDELESDTQTQQGLDPRIAAKLAKVDELEQRWNSMTEKQQSEANYAEYREEKADPLLKEAGVPEGYWDVIAEAALNRPAVHTPNGLVPDIQGAWNQFVEQYLDPYLDTPTAQQKVKKTWAGNKQRTAFTSTGGAEGKQALDVSDPEQRVAYAMARLQADQQ
jgi:hypothetical protein